MEAACFNRFVIEMPEEAAMACSHTGDCSGGVTFWAPRITRPAECTAAALQSELKEYGAWNEEQLADDAANWERIVWVAACDIREQVRAC